MATALDFVSSAMRKAGILTKTESPSADEAADGLEMMNDMLESWANNSLTVPYQTLESFTLSSGTANYTIGSGGMFNTTRPVSIVSVYVRDGVTDYPLTPVISEQTYSLITNKDTVGTPEWFSYNSAYPLGIIRLYPVPDQNYTIFLLSEKKVGGYSLSDTVSLPDGWARAIKYNLAVELSSEYGQQVPESVAYVAKESMTSIKTAAAKNRPIDAAPLGRGVLDVYTGYNR